MGLGISKHTVTPLNFSAGMKECLEGDGEAGGIQGQVQEDLPEHQRTCQNHSVGAWNSSKVDLTKLLSHWAGASCLHTAYAAAAEYALITSLREDQLKHILLLQPFLCHANAYAPQASTVELGNVNEANGLHHTEAKLVRPVCPVSAIHVKQQAGFRIGLHNFKTCCQFCRMPLS
eukprot:SM000175S03294  [mRNA]  locus=s175:141900:145362:+ [translate_table: standard]